MEEVGGFICDFCYKSRHEEELHAKHKDGRKQCDSCYTRMQDIKNESKQEKTV